MNTLDLRTTEEILRDQIKELNALLDLKNQRIKELEALRTIPNIFIPEKYGPFWQIDPQVYAPPNPTSTTTTVTLTPEQQVELNKSICNIPEFAFKCKDCKCGA